ncbi:MAG TPA: hypothetical protein VFY25_07715 [Anaerolineales bacterium]|nr:hypothetical protein [Anaerolineales bacterium]
MTAGFRHKSSETHAEQSGKDYHPEDEVHYSWFAHEDPSPAAQGYFTYLNNFAGIAQGC